MIKITKTSIIVFVISLIFSFLLTGLSYAQEENPEQTAQKLGISFPIAELGNCNSVTECKSFCDSEANHDQCVSFAKQKGLYKERPKSSELVNIAKTELGCDSESSCRAICEKEENREKCSNFAQKHGLGGSPKGRPGDSNVLNKAKELLGCDSESSCKAVCENPANQEKCSNFAKATGLGGGIRRVGPGGCNSEESCRAYCETHQEECGIPGSDRKGPGGCNSEASCKAYCESHPEECGRQDGVAPQGAEDKFCRENPEKCAEGRGGPRNSEGQRPERGDERKDERRKEIEERRDQREFRPTEEQRLEQPREETKEVTEPQTVPTTEVRGISSSASDVFFRTLLSWFGF